MGSNLPIPPEEHKLKDDYIVDVQVSCVALVFNDTSFKTTSQNRKLLCGHHIVYCYFFFLNCCAIGLNTVHLLRILLLRKCKIINNKCDHFLCSKSLGVSSHFLESILAHYNGSLSPDF